jgi:hypothetical protein
MALKKYTLERVYLPSETLGSWYDDARFIICKTMELPWRDNKSSADSSEASCVPEGLYKLKKQPPKVGRDYGYFRFEYVQGRRIDPVTKMSHILVHRITYVKDLLGCIGVGSEFGDINKDGVPDMTGSGVKLEWMYKNLPDEFLLEIKKKDENNKEVNLK